MAQTFVGMAARGDTSRKQALKAKSSKDSSVSGKLDILITSVSYLNEDYKEFKNRLALFEARVERSSR